MHVACQIVPVKWCVLMRFIRKLAAVFLYLYPSDFTIGGSLRLLPKGRYIDIPLLWLIKCQKLMLSCSCYITVWFQTLPFFVGIFVAKEEGSISNQSSYIAVATCRST